MARPASPPPGAGITQEQLPAVREHELNAAAAFLGVADVDLLGYRDSGMDGTAPNGASVNAPVEGVAAYRDDRRAAIAIHASQVSPFAALPDDLARAFLATDHLQRVVPPLTETELERDVLTGAL